MLFRSEGIIFATAETNRLLGSLMGVSGSVLDDSAVVAQTMLDLLAAAQEVLRGGTAEHWERSRNALRDAIAKAEAQGC